MKEHISTYTQELSRQLTVATTIALGVTSLTALGLKEWRQARAEETAALKAKEANDNAATDAAYKDAWCKRMDAENGLTPEEEDQIQPGE